MSGSPMSILPELVPDDTPPPAESQQPFEALFPGSPAAADSSAEWETLFPAGRSDPSDSIFDDALPNIDNLAQFDSEPALGEFSAGDDRQLAVQPVLDHMDLSGESLLATEADQVPTMPVAEHEAALAALEQQHADQISALTRHHTEEIGAACLQAREDFLTQAPALLENAVASALAPLCGSLLKELAVRQLAEELAQIVADDRAGKVVVAGPDTLIEQVRERAGEGASRLEFRPGDGVQLRVDVDETVIRTCVDRWAAQLGDPAS